MTRPPTPEEAAPVPDPNARVNPVVLPPIVGYLSNAALLQEFGAPAAPGVDAAKAAGANKVRAVEHLGHHMEKISADPSGSNPALYYSVPKLADLREFYRFLCANNWHGTQTLSMKVRKYSDKPVWDHKHTYPMADIWKKRLLMDIGEKHQGAFVGLLACGSYRQPTYLCDDFTLRSIRGPELHESFGDGAGRLPDPDEMLPALDVYSRDLVDHSRVVTRSRMDFRDFLYHFNGLPKPHSLEFSRDEFEPGELARLMPRR